ncbi:unnamed protein product [Diabrotica balteata]|uniref:Regulatory protein zeste n=1 Tax=Diabrotica balteata TaxID=107213 RepID=A0A9P0GWW2_DIABA|nr:unnamed protein product [Diabrotica balteata]
MEVKQEYSETCQVEIDYNDLNDPLLDGFKCEIKEESNQESTDNMFDSLALKEFPVKTKIEQDGNKLTSFKAKQKTKEAMPYFHMPLKFSISKLVPLLLYTREDKEILIVILKKYPIIENKNTNATTIKKKSEAWNAVMHDYNTVRTEISTVTQLKCCWDKIKRQKKMELSKERQNRMSTGGGGGIPDINILPDVEVIATHLSEEVTNLVNSDAQYMGNKLCSGSRSSLFRNNPVASCDMVMVKGNIQYDT